MEMPGQEVLGPGRCLMGGLLEDDDGDDLSKLLCPFGDQCY